MIDEPEAGLFKQKVAEDPTCIMTKAFREKDLEHPQLLILVVVLLVKEIGVRLFLVDVLLRLVFVQPAPVDVSVRLCIFDEQTEGA